MSTHNRLRLLTPEDWRQLPLHDDEALQRAAAAVVRRQFAGFDDQPLLKRDLTATLVDHGRRARTNGSFEMYLCYEHVAGVPLAVSMLATLLAVPFGNTSLRAVMRAFVGEDASVEAISLPSGRAARSQRLTPAEGIAGLGVPDGHDCMLVDYALLGPPGTVLVLSFSSPLVQIAEALAGLFEAVASSVEWVP